MSKKEISDQGKEKVCQNLRFDIPQLKPKGCL